jgi:hypothetical protein
MTKRYFGDLDNYAESDIVIIGAGESHSSTQHRTACLARNTGLGPMACDLVLLLAFNRVAVARTFRKQYGWYAP